jgi:hypothetical protein
MKISSPKAINWTLKQYGYIHTYIDKFALGLVIVRLSVIHIKAAFGLLVFVQGHNKGKRIIGHQG